MWASIPFSSARAIENDPTKEYRLSEKNGPWMVMVATFRDVKDEDRKSKEGLSATEAANKLVHELRAKGIPAYVYSQDEVKTGIDTFDRLGNKDKRKYIAQRDMICVLAGNYQKIEDPIAQKTLTHIKKFQPKFLSDPRKVGANVMTVANGQKGPFSNAFLTINPARDPNEVVQSKVDETTRTLNSGIQYPLVNVKHKYTLKVATFTGKSAVPLGNSKFNGREANFEKSLGNAFNLDRAGEDATQLTYALRQDNLTMKALNRPKFESYVYHDKFQSIVTVGGFDSDKDPRIKDLIEVFRAKYRSDDIGQYELVGESLSLPGQVKGSPPIQTWAFDPVPEVIAIPRLK